jgi:glutaredoxin
MARNSLMLVALALLVAAPAQAERLYKWVDEQGRVTYLDHPPPEGQGKVEEKDLKMRGGAGGGDPATADAAAKAPVTLYSTAGCDSCDAARKQLQKRKIPFKDVDVSASNPEAQVAMRKKVGELAVPTISVGSKILRGYVDSQLDGALDEAGYPKAEPPAEGEAGSGETAPQR